MWLRHSAKDSRDYRKIVGRYYNDEIDWNRVLDDDEKNVRKGGWRTHVLGWSAWLLIAAGVIIGFINLQKESARVRTEKTIDAAAEAKPAEDSSARLGQGGGQEPRGDTEDDRHGSVVTPASTAKKEVSK